MSAGIDWAPPRKATQQGRVVESPFKADVVGGQVVLVTGGGSGIGLAIALQLGLHGAHVAIFGRTKEKLEAAAASLRSSGVKEVLCLVGDVRKLEDAHQAISSVLSRFGRLDILVRLSAISVPGRARKDTSRQTNGRKDRRPLFLRRVFLCAGLSVTPIPCR
jgi:NAD(P)-dependent dehydrogenase (short-subunit alcohol dehydrogenase family)